MRFSAAEVQTIARPDGFDQRGNREGPPSDASTEHPELPSIAKQDVDP